MRYAKVLNGEVVKFPYSVNDLQAENPNIVFGVVKDMVSVYQTTEDAQSGAFLVEVEDSEVPSTNYFYEYLQRKTMPDIVDGKYFWGWDVIKRTEEETNKLLALAEETKNGS